MSTNLFKIEVFLPEEAQEVIMKALAGTRAGEIGNYERCFALTPVTGTFRPKEGGHPHTGNVGEIAFVKELKLEVNCRKEDVSAAIKAVRQAHPYEEPLINVISLQNGEFGATL
jgi:hypothetical protein